MIPTLEEVYKKLKRLSLQVTYLLSKGIPGSGTVTEVDATAGTGISVSGVPINTTGTIVITNTAPDQTVSITDAGNITVAGTYPSFTVAVTIPSTSYASNAAAVAALGTGKLYKSTTLVNGSPQILLTV